MIGFIIIGRNEGTNLVRCINSIKIAIEENNIKEYELIYVDSDSTDNSIELVSNIPDVQIFKILTGYNPAVARNIGAKESKADILFFADGDMEIMRGFLPKVTNDYSYLNYGFVSGHFQNYYYDGENNFLYKEPYQEPEDGKYVYQITSGGLFIIQRAIWEKAGGMRTRFRTGEDLDLGLRLAKQRIKLMRRQELLAIHHTIQYKSRYRIWQDLFSGKSLYARGVLYRSHLFNKYMYRRLIKSDPTVLCLIVTTCLCIIFGNILFLGTYFIITLGIIMGFTKHQSLREYLVRYSYQIIRDLFTVLSFAFFYPKNKKFNYVRIV